MSVIKVLAVVGATVAALIGISIFSAGANNSNVDAMLMKAASDFNLKLPMMVDSETQLRSTMGANNTFTYMYVMINYKKEDLDVEKFHSLMKSQVENTTCTTKALKPFVDLKIIVSYSYYDSESVQITEIAVDTKDCGKI